MWRFSQFFACRWTTVGHSCRTVALACATGFSECFAFLHERKFVSDFEASGAELLDEACKKFCLCIGLAAFLLETFLNHLMQDNRLLKTHLDVEALLSEELCFLIPSIAWQMLASHFCDDACQLQKHTLDATHTLHTRFLSGVYYPSCMACLTGWPVVTLRRTSRSTDCRKSRVKMM
eukprot:6473440-Amphidinium_carterae.2